MGSKAFFRKFGAALASKPKFELLFLLVAMAIAGVLGYAINIFVKRSVSAPEFVEFSTFWGALYLGVGLLSGLQQEVTRSASTPLASEIERRSTGTKPRQVVGFGLFITTVGVFLCFLFFLPPNYFGLTNGIGAGLLFLGLAGYVIVATMTGLLYGVANGVKVIAVMIASDAALRFLLVSLQLKFGYSATLIELATGVPFLLVPLLVYPYARKFLTPGVLLVGSPIELMKNSASTMTAAGAMAFLISGFPIAIRWSLGSTDTGLLATLIFVVTLARAPLIIVAMSLQSFLVARIRQGADSGGLLSKVGWFLALFSGLFSAGLAATGDVIFSSLAGQSIHLEFGIYLAVGLSSGFIAAMFVFGATLLAKDNHVAYLTMWLVSAGITLVLCSFDASPDLKLAAILVVPPSIGLLSAVGWATQIKIRNTVLEE
jgi:hypothetical protein